MTKLLATIRSLEDDNRTDLAGTVYDLVSFAVISMFVATVALNAEAIAALFH